MKHTKCDSADQRAVGTILMNYILIKNNGRTVMKTIEERAEEYVERHRSVEVCYFTPGGSYSYHAEKVAYEVGATEQKAIDDKEIKKLKSIVENSAIVLGIGGVEWVNENARQVAIEELRQEIFRYYEDN